MRSELSQYWVRQAGLTTLYVFGAWIATRFVTLSDDLVLIWPPAGLSFAAVLVYGPRAWPFIPMGAALCHTWFAPVPALFWPFSLLSNALATVIAVGVMRRHSSNLSMEFNTRTGFQLLAGGLLQAVTSAAIGSSGLILSGMIPAEQWFAGWMRWTLADLFGVIVVGPFVLGFAHAIRQRRPLGQRRFRSVETTLWLLCLLLSLLAQAVFSAWAPSNALVLSFLPAAVLMWSALRLAPLSTTGGVLIVGVVIAAYANFGFGGFQAPRGIADIAVLLTFLLTLTIFTLTIAAGQYESRRAARELLVRASTDRLTGLGNRSAFEEHAIALIERAPLRPLTVAYLDLDQFKVVNDTLGHAVGDQFLRGLAGVLASQIGPGDRLARLGGDEFAVILTEAGAERAQAWARQALAAVERYRMGHEGHVLSATASLGMVVLDQAGQTFQDVFSRIDAACSVAKELGGNRVQLSSPGDGTLADRDAAMRWAMRLNSAVEQEQFELYFQHIISLRPGQSAEKIEILLRLRDGDGKLLLPGRFIPALERLNLSSRLDRHVFERVLDWFEQHPQVGGLPRRIAINLSAASLADESLADFIEHRLSRTALSPQSLIFEITETGVVRDLNMARAFIQRIRALGCGVALDDFGAGYCSFAYLRDLPVDVLKIDGSFVRELPDSALAVAVVRSMVEIARVLGMRTVAECVETEAVRQCLIELGVDHAQGFALHMPEPLEFILNR